MGPHGCVPSHHTTTLLLCLLGRLTHLATDHCPELFIWVLTENYVRVSTCCSATGHSADTVHLKAVCSGCLDESWLPVGQTETAGDEVGWDVLCSLGHSSLPTWFHCSLTPNSQFFTQVMGYCLSFWNIPQSLSYKRQASNAFVWFVCISIGSRALFLSCFLFGPHVDMHP